MLHATNLYNDKYEQILNNQRTTTGIGNFPTVQYRYKDARSLVCWGWGGGRLITFGYARIKDRSFVYPRGDKERSLGSAEEGSGGQVPNTIR